MTWLAPFSVRSFRFQWPADLLTSWAQEMETLILGWIILEKTGSVFLLTLFGSLQFIGTLSAPILGVAGDRFGRRGMALFVRASVGLVACVILLLAITDHLTPPWILGCAFASGLIRPGDLITRNSLIGDTMTPAMLFPALGLMRITMDSARIIGALTGAALFAWLGVTVAYVGVVTFYSIAFLLTLGVARSASASKLTSWSEPWKDMRAGLAYAWNTPLVLAALVTAFLVNLTAFPITNGLLPYVAREVYRIDATGLGQLSAAFAVGGLAGSIVMTMSGPRLQTGTVMIVGSVLWNLALFGFAYTSTLEAGIPSLIATGFMQSLSMLTIAGILLRATDERYRARVMGLRMLAVYGLPLGVLGLGPLIAASGYFSTVALYGLGGSAILLFVARHWRAVLFARSVAARASGEAR